MSKLSFRNQYSILQFLKEYHHNFNVKPSGYCVVARPSSPDEPTNLRRQLDELDCYRYFLRLVTNLACGGTDNKCVHVKLRNLQSRLGSSLISKKFENLPCSACMTKGAREVWLEFPSGADSA